ncbi:MAG TPA: TonB-dependent receptor [Vicinamibacterales bacterium]|nr:TonB-dependent receptor [Vicinamibacterales bacterium]
MLRSVSTTFSLVVLAVLLSHPLPARAQSAAFGGALRGAVIDPDGRPVPGAEVLVTARAAVVARATTDESGAFAVTDLPPDRYEIRVARDGFRAEPVALDLAVGDSRTLTLRLQVSAISEVVVVSAAQVDLPLSRTPAATTVIPRVELRALQQNTIAAALRRVPGISIARNGGEGSVTSLFSRGGESDFTAVLIDDVPVNAFGGGFDFGHLTTGDVERVEVVRGPQSALWSGGAIGGTIQIVTRKDAGRALDASAEAGSRAFRRLSASAGLPAGEWRVSLGGERSSSRGFTGPSAAGEPVANDDWRSEHLSAGLTRGGATRVTVSSRLERSERGNPGPFGSDPGGTYGGVDRVSRGTNRSLLLGGSVSRAFGRVRPGGRISWFRLESDYASPFGASDLTSHRLIARGHADLRLTRRIDATAGAEWLHEQATSTYITGASGTPVPVRRSVASAFGEARVEAGNAFLTAGLRAEAIHRATLDADPNAFSPRPVLPANTELAVTPRLSASWFVRPGNARGEWTRIRASAGLGIRPPDVFELAFTDNPGLAPERTTSLEAGVEHAIAGGRLVAEATAFLNRYDDLIVAIGRSLSDVSRYQSDNVSNARSRGIEALVAARTRHGFRASAAYTLLDAEVLAVDRLGVAPPPFVPGDSLLRRPRHQFWADASWTGSKASAFLSLGARGRTLDVDPSAGAFGGLFTNSGYASADAGVAWRVTPVLEIFGRVTNLADRRYEEVLGFPAAGRSAYAGVRIAARR